MRYSAGHSKVKMGKMFKDKRGVEFKSSIFAIIVVGLIVTAVGVIINDWGIEYGSGVTSDLGSYNKVGDVSSYVEGSQSRVNPQSSETSSDAETTTYRGVWSIIVGIWTPFRLSFNMIDSVFETYNIPGYIKLGIITMIIFAVLTTIVAIIFRFIRPNV